MAYATASEMSDLIGSTAYLLAADRDGDGSADSDAVDSALEKASGTADSYIAKWLPLSSTPEALKDAVIRIAHYQLTGETGNEEIRKRYEDALKWLRDIAKGVAGLGASTPTATVGGGADFDSGDKVMNRDDLGKVM